MRVLRAASVCFVVLAASACKGGGDGGGEKTVPPPLAPGEVTTLTLCGSGTSGTGCGDQQTNVIQFRVGGESARACPCFTYSILNLSLADLGSATNTTYEFTGFRPGTYQVTGQAISGFVDFTFWHNTSTSTIGVVPSSLQSLSGPARATNESCRIGYSPAGDQLPASFSFQFTIAAATGGGSC